jgi:hypothetical protein
MPWAISPIKARAAARVLGNPIFRTKRGERPANSRAHGLARHSSCAPAGLLTLMVALRSTPE